MLSNSHNSSWYCKKLYKHIPNVMKLYTPLIYFKTKTLYPSYMIHTKHNMNMLMMHQLTMLKLNY